MKFAYPPGAGGGGTWGSITGTLSSQTDLQAALDAKLTMLADPNADRILFWDDSAGSHQWLTLGTNLSITGTTLDAAGGGSGGAPTTASYVTLGTDATLTNERVLTGTSNQIALTDNGAGSTIVLSTPQDIGTSSAVQFGTAGIGAALPATSGIGEPLFGVTTGLWSAYNSTRPAMVQFQRDFTEPPDSSPGAVQDVLRVYVTSSQAGTVAQGRSAVTSYVGDSAAVVNKTITGAANNGSGLIRITAASHGFATSDRIQVYGVTGTTEANGVWTITVITANTFDLQGSTFSNAYVSGGTATNRGLLYAFKAIVNPTLARNQITTGTGAYGDDLNGVVVQNVGSAVATEAFYVGASSGVGSGAGPQQGWYAGFSMASDADYGLLITNEQPSVSSSTGLDAAAAAIWPTYTPNDTTTETRRALSVKPTINAGGSNTNKTLNVVEIDTDETSATGFTPNLLKISRDGTQKFLFDSAGTLNATTGTITASTPAVSITQTWNNGAVQFNGVSLDITDTASSSLSTLFDFKVGGTSRLSLNNQGTMVNISKAGANAGFNNYAHANSTTANTVVATMLGYVSAGTATTPLRTQAGQVGMRLGAGGYMAVDDATSATHVAAHRAALDFVVGVSDWTTTDNEMFVRFRTTGPGSTSAAARAYINAQGLTIGATTASRGTTQPTNAINIFDGTAPVGTLTNGISLYSTAGELRVMDAAGNATLLSPHEKGTNYWIYDSVLSTTGKRLRIDVERLLRAMDAQLGGGYIHES